MNDIAEHIKKLANKGDEVYTVVCKVLSVDANERTCDVKPHDDSANILGVRLQADLNSDTGFMIVPEVGSNVLVSFLNKNAAYVAMCSEVDCVHLRGDGLGGLIKIRDLVTRLNNIENDLNSLKTAFNSWLTAGGDGGAALKLITATWFGSQLELTDKFQLENTKVNHG